MGLLNVVFGNEVAGQTVRLSISCELHTSFFLVSEHAFLSS